MQDTGLKRNTKDQYFTKKEVVDICLQHWYEKIATIQNFWYDEQKSKNGILFGLSKIHQLKMVDLLYPLSSFKKLLAGKKC